MTTVSTADAIQRLPALLELRESVVIRNGDEDVAMLISLRPGPASEEERQARWAKFLKTSDEASSELHESLARDGISLEEFLKDNQ